VANTVDEQGRVTASPAPTAGGLDINAIVGQAMMQSAIAGNASAANQAIIPLWMARPSGGKKVERVNPGQAGEIPGQLPGRFAVDVTPSPSYFTTDYASSAFLNMDDKQRSDFQKRAIGAGLIGPKQDLSPDVVAGAWSNAVKYAAQYNADRDEKEWISPWEAVDKLGALNAAGKGGAYDPFKPRTTSSSQTTKRDFTRGSDAEAVTRQLEGLFEAEMGRAPTTAERSVYQRLVQKAYEASPEVSKSVSTTDAAGNTTGTTTQSGGIDMTATLLDQVRSNPESQAYDAGVTFFQSAMKALGAIA
jgi:hypothetical protein